VERNARREVPPPNPKKRKGLNTATEGRRISQNAWPKKIKKLEMFKPQTTT